MSEIALICTSPFQEMESFKNITLPSLMSQTCQDFTFYYLDCYYSHNQQYFRELQENPNVKFKIVHCPGLHAIHYPHFFTWEQYNSAVLLSQENQFLRLGRFRSYHPHIVEFVLNILNIGIVLNFPHSVKPIDFNTVHFFTHTPLTWGGMIAMYREDWIHLLNGEDEVGLHWVHFEDFELVHRISNLPLLFLSFTHAVTRHEHNKEIQSTQFDEPISQSPYPREILGYNSDLKNRLQSHPDFKSLIHDGFEWFYNEKYNILCPSDFNEYLEWTQNRKQSIVGFNHLMIGRNLRKLDSDLVCDINERIQQIHDSWMNPIYFRE